MMETETEEAQLLCPTCRNVLNVNREVMTLEDQCPVCQSLVNITVFPRLFRKPAEERDGKPVKDGESPCSFFPELAAEKVCDECGCLMSPKATVRWGDQEVCLPCLYRLREEKQAPAYLPKAALQDNRALALVTLLAPLSLISAPVALVLLLRSRKWEKSLVSRGRWRWWLALVLSLGWIVAWTAILIAWASLVLEELS